MTWISNWIAVERINQNLTIEAKLNYRTAGIIKIKRERDKNKKDHKRSYRGEQNSQ